MPDDLDELLNFDRRIFGAFPDDLFPAEYWEELESYWMYADTARVGCCAFSRDCDYDGSFRPQYLFIASTGILPKFQGKGLGRKQKEWQITYARSHGFSVIVTNMRESNARIRRLNESLGFKIRCVEKDYYREPSEATVVMELNL